MCKKYTLNVFLFVVNMRIVGTDENLRPLTGKVKICFLLLQGLNVMSVIIQVFPTSFYGLDCSLCCKIPNYISIIQTIHVCAYQRT